jgi:predicted Zn-dependent protease
MRKNRRSGRASLTGTIVAVLLAVLVTGPAAKAAASLPPEMERLGEEGAVLLQNLEFDRAITIYDRICREYPSHPAGWVMLATAAWWQAWQGLARPEDVLTPETDRILEHAIELARAMSAAPGAYCESRFFLGGAIGVKAHCALLRGNWLTAVKGGRESIQLLRQLAECSEYSEEAYLGMGIYEYQAARLPWSLRWISRFLIGGYGTTENALAHLERAATKSRWMRFDAQATLVGFYTLTERTPGKALPHARNMARERPSSPLTRLLLARTLNYDGRFAEALEVASSSPETCRVGPILRCEQGIALTGLGRLPEAEAVLVPAMEVGDGNIWTGAVRLTCGQVLDLMGSRTQAVAKYRLVAACPDRKSQAETAKRRIRQPYTWTDFEREIHPR